MQRICKQCSAEFEVTNDDLAFYDKVSPVFNGRKELIPPPTLCPECRLQRRLAFRNQIYVYTRPSSTSGKPIFSMYTEYVRFPVIENEEWWSDRWDPLDCGKEFDFSRPFFEQFAELLWVTPHPALAVMRVENSEYCNNVSNIKDCYLVFNTSNAEGCMYVEWGYGSRDCIDCSETLRSELCYDSVGCLRCHNVQNVEFSEDCSDSFFLSHCRGCRQCFGCVNLRHAEYCVFNEQKTKVEYEHFLQEFSGSSFRAREEMQKRLDAFVLKHPRPHAIFHHVENVSGNIITESRDVHNSFFIERGESLRYCFGLHDEGAKDCQDYSIFGRHAELLYESAICGINVFHLLFCCTCRDGSAGLQYCWYVDGSTSCFGCVGLRKKRYCILNKQYTEEEYNFLVSKIIEHMRETREWGEFFPMHLSPIPYNQSTAQLYFPLTTTEAADRRLQWYKRAPEQEEDAIDASTLSDGLPATDDPIIVKSTLSDRPFKIIPQEIKRYRQLQVPLPRITYDERMEERAKKLGGITLYERTCAKTGKPILTTYPPDSPFIIWDREVYEQEFGG